MFDESFSSALSYKSRPFAEAMAMRPAVTYTPYATSSKEQTGDVITFTRFEEGNLLSETCNDTESGDESDSESIMMSDYTTLFRSRTCSRWPDREQVRDRKSVV